ncbi:MAG TPA: c-type cytochrome domain-containing protein [Planctomycetaceae bacterium]|nr:c-type cytochrome domain-containing protein [Planctomycetaceae bacterium]
MSPKDILVAAIVALAQGAISAQELPPPSHGSAAAPAAAERARAFLNRHCLECHGAEKPKGMFRVDRHSADFGDRVERERWKAVLKRIRAGEMPPKTKPRPPEKEITELTD